MDEDYTYDKILDNDKFLDSLQSSWESLRMPDFVFFSHVFALAFDLLDKKLT
jgi:hypothetical protein